jgi:hypothetical protein
VTTLEDLAEQALSVSGIESVAIFVRGAPADSAEPGAVRLKLGAAAGVAGIALERLVAAVQDPAHPIARSLAENVAAFDVTPMAPGGPALRSHIPVPDTGPTTSASGVLAVAHDLPLDAAARDRLTAIANEAATTVA